MKKLLSLFMPAGGEVFFAVNLSGIAVINYELRVDDNVASAGVVDGAGVSITGQSLDGWVDVYIDQMYQSNVTGLYFYDNGQESIAEAEFSFSNFYFVNLADWFSNFSSIDDAIGGIYDNVLTSLKKNGTITIMNYTPSELEQSELDALMKVLGWTINGETYASIPIALRTRQDIEVIPGNLAGNYKLMNNIDLGGKVYDTHVIDGIFTGTFDGGYKTIYNIDINAPSNKASLFKRSDVDSTIHSVKCLGNAISKDDCGLLISQNYGHIYNCCGEGVVDGDFGGVLIGFNAGLVNDCYVSNSSRTGISLATASGAVVGYNYMGGITVNCCSFLEQGLPAVGAYVPNRSYNCYHLGSTSTTESTALTAEQMKAPDYLAYIPTTDETVWAYEEDEYGDPIQITAGSIRYIGRNAPVAGTNNYDCYLCVKDTISFPSKSDDWVWLGFFDSRTPRILTTNPSFDGDGSPWSKVGADTELGGGLARIYNPTGDFSAVYVNPLQADTNRAYTAKYSITDNSGTYNRLGCQYMPPLSSAGSVNEGLLPAFCEVGDHTLDVHVISTDAKLNRVISGTDITLDYFQGTEILPAQVWKMGSEYPMLIWEKAGVIGRYGEIPGRYASTIQDSIFNISADRYGAGK